MAFSSFSPPRLTKGFALPRRISSSSGLTGSDALSTFRWPIYTSPAMMFAWAFSLLSHNRA